MAQQQPFNLFVYGTLMNPDVLRGVTGLRLVGRKEEADGSRCFYARRAILSGYRKISPDHTYLYAVPDPLGRIRGYVIGPLPPEQMASLLHYEGRNYSRRAVTVQTRGGPVQAVAFLANLKQLQHAFGYDFHDHYKQEILLEEKIEAALLEAEEQQVQTTDRLARRAVAELHGSTIRDLRRRHFEAGGISDYAIRHALLDTPLPDYRRIRDDPQAAALAPNYLRMAIRQVILNQFEDRIRRDFRYELDHLGSGPEYYERTISLLAALRLVNQLAGPVEMIAADILADLSFPAGRLVEFVEWAILVADELYDWRLASQQVQDVRDHKGNGYIPMGAELEFSNIGHAVIRDPEGRCVRDPVYDGFLYFPDYSLDVLTWKLGGHVDDHHDKASSSPRRGFFEIALGNLSVRANISKPLTDDPWVLNQLIHEARRFYPIGPHSLHISLQLRKQQRPEQDRLLSMASMKCLFAIAGDPVRLPDGRVQLRRLSGEEIISREAAPQLLFSSISKRHSMELDGLYPSVRTRHAGGVYVQQFKFLRLSPAINYEPIAMALKGLQISRRPGSFLTAPQYESSPKHRRAFDELVEWGTAAQPLTEAEMDFFLSAVHDGLMTERRGKPAHSGTYISWALQELRAELDRFNRLIDTPPPMRIDRRGAEVAGRSGGRGTGGPDTVRPGTVRPDTPGR